MRTLALVVVESARIFRVIIDPRRIFRVSVIASADRRIVLLPYVVVEILPLSRFILGFSAIIVTWTRWIIILHDRSTAMTMIGGGLDESGGVAEGHPSAKRRAANRR